MYTRQRNERVDYDKYAKPLAIGLQYCHLIKIFDSERQRNYIFQ